MKKIIAAGLVALSLFTVTAKGAPKVSLSGPNVKAKEYTSIQAALDAIGAQKGDFTITLPTGTYEEVLYYKGAANITLSGNTKRAHGADVIIAKDNNGDLLRNKKASSAQKNRCLFEFEGTGNLTLENVTLHNTFDRTASKGSNTQAETVGFDSTGNLAAYNCTFKSHQDTLRTTGKAWFYKCYIEGDTDFLWMEASGKVALYEACEIVSVYDAGASNHTSYICAPRMEKGNAAAKGLVIFNSTVSSQKGQATYLARTPWTSGYYNQVAFVGNKASDLNASVWSGNPLLAEGIPRTIIGWKLDAKTAQSMGIKTAGRDDVLSDADVAKEFNGRHAILNRFYDMASLKYKKDTETYWDVDALVKSRGWTVSADSSKALLAGEVESVKVTYVLDGNNDYADVSYNGFAQEKGKAHFVGAEGNTISFPVKGKSLVTVTGYYAGNGTIKAGKQGAATYDFNNGSTSKFAEKTYVVYEGATTVTITATKKSYITKITVEGDEGLSFIPVKSIAISAEGNATEVAGRKTLQLSATLNPAKPTNGDFVWSVSDEKAATISESGVLAAANVPKDTVITVKATARDANGVSAEKKITVLKPEAGAFGVTWLDSPKASASLEGTSDNEQIVKAGKAKGSSGTWSFNSSKITADIAKGSISYSGYSSPLAGKDKVYVDFPLTAVTDLVITEINAAFGNHGTGNMAAMISAVNGKNVTELVNDTSRDVRSVKKQYVLKEPFTIKKGETVTLRVTLYGWTGQEIAIPTGKAPTVATITVSGKQK